MGQVHLRRSHGSKRLSLRVSGLDGRVTLTVPPATTDRAARGFVLEHRGWLQERLVDLSAPSPVSSAQALPFEGAMIPVLGGDSRVARLDQSSGALLVPRERLRRGTAIKALFKLQARDRLAQAADRFADQIGRPYTRLTLRDTRSRWGSCSSSGGLMFSWRLIMAPADVLAYVAAHEIAHLRHMNHSADYWACLEELFPDFEAPRSWLRDQGNALHRWDFDN